MALTRKFLPIIFLLACIVNMNNARNEIVGKKYAGDFCFNYGKTYEHGCFYNVTNTDDVKCTVEAAMVGPALSNITNVHIRVIKVCVDNMFTGNLFSDADKRQVIDITALERFPGLLVFVISTYPRVIRDLFHLHYDSSTFQHMNQLEYFLLNIPIHIVNTTSMQLLDLKYRPHTGFECVLIRISKLSARGLNVRGLQKAQVKGYAINNMPLFFSDFFRLRNVTFKKFKTLLDEPCLKSLCMSWLYPGMLRVFTKEKYAYSRDSHNKTSKPDVDYIECFNALYNQNQSQKVLVNAGSNQVCSCKKDSLSGIVDNPQISRIGNDQYNVSKLPTIMNSIGFMFLAFLLILGYYKRFTVKYYIFKFHQLLHCCRRTTLVRPQRSYNYDVFVSYCAEDRFWVHDILLKQLENVYQFKLCIHYRDFPAGGSISDVIVKKLNQSREIIFVLSDHFISTLTQHDRPWVQFELDEACDLVRLRKKNIIVIKMGHITKPVIDRNLAYLLDGSNIFLEWPANPKGHKVFWAKLISDLYGDTQGCLSCCFNTRRNIGHRDINAFSRLDSSDEESDNSDDVAIMGNTRRSLSRGNGSWLSWCRKQSIEGYTNGDIVVYDGLDS